MKQPFRYLMLLSAITLPAVTFAEVSEDHLQALEARIAQLEAGSTDAARPTVKGAGIKINGFMSAGVTWLDDDTLAYDGGVVSSNVDWRSSSRVGLQFDMPVNERVSALVQLLALGADDFDPYLPLAYISYRPTAQDEFRVGRQRTPFFMFSEYLDVGYAYPWARPPVETYSAALPINIEGASWSHRFSTDTWAHDFQFIFGDTKVAIPGLDGHLDDLAGVNLMSTHDNLTLRAGYLWTTRASGTAPALQPLGAAPMVDVDASFAGLGAQYDNGSLLMIAEFTSLRVDGFFPDSDGSFLTLGWRFGKLLPTLTVAETKVVDSSDRTNPMLPLACDMTSGTNCLGPNPDPATQPFAPYIPFPANTLNQFLDAEQQSVTLGLRYDYLPNASAKFDVSAVTDTGDGWGAATPLDANGNGSNVDEQLFGKPDTPIIVYRLVFDVVF